ncbi:YfiR family protein [Desulforegula conservatrix]|uniref:YfiR family protein n=1 Tax=Desulforegula conservatrix TaxID=153026 RepID=UPI0003F88BBF|nr:YfiR family protein [Desulforegula conservatrix]
MIKKSIRIFLSAFLAPVFFVSMASAGETGREYVVKAAFLYNFIKFVSWENEQTPDSVNICAFGDPEFIRDLKTIEGKKAHEKNISVTEMESLNNSIQCNVLFISRYESQDYKKIMAEAEKNRILTISDIDGFAEKGGIIELFTTDDNRIRFRINIRAAEKSGLKISSELLKLAVIVGKDN